MNPTVINVVKIIVKVASIAAPIAVGYFDNKDLDKKIAEKAAEAVAQAMKKES